MLRTEEEVPTKMRRNMSTVANLDQPCGMIEYVLQYIQSRVDCASRSEGIVTPRD